MGTTSFALSRTTAATTEPAPGDLTIPDEPRGLVVFALGATRGTASGVGATPAGDARRSGAIAIALQTRGFATLVLDEVTDLTDALAAIVDAVAWIARQDRIACLPVALFGTGIGAAAALVAATRTPATAVVALDGRLDLADEHLALVRCPSLLAVSLTAPATVLAQSSRALRHMDGSHQLHVATPASRPHELVDAAAGWFETFVPAVRAYGGRDDLWGALQYDCE